MTDWTVAVVSPPGYQHSATFNDVALALQGAFIDLGFSCHCTSRLEEISGRSLILGANLLRIFKMDVPADAILLNLEQGGKLWMTKDYLHLLQSHEVWDYSAANIHWLNERGIKAKLCRIGYHPCLNRRRMLPAPPIEYIDVLFVGSDTERRTKIMKGMWLDGVCVYSLFGCYGPERDAYIARAKIVLNLHAWDEGAPLELVRLQLLFANAKCVLTEVCRPDDLEWQSYRGCMAEADPDGMAEVAKHLLGDDKLRWQLGQVGYNTFRANPQSRFLADALGLAYPNAVAPQHPLALNHV